MQNNTHIFDVFLGLGAPPKSHSKGLDLWIFGLGVLGTFGSLICWICGNLLLVLKGNLQQNKNTTSKQTVILKSKKTAPHKPKNPHFGGVTR